MGPNPDFISREIKNEPLAQLLNKLGNSLSECVNFGSNLVGRISHSKTLDIQDAVLATNLRHFIEQIDACSELLKLSISEPCLVLLRAALESFINGSYILQSDHENRGNSFMYFQFLEQIKILDKLDSETDAGKQMAAIIRKDAFLHGLTLSPPKDSANIKSNIIARMNSQSYATVHAEYTRLKSINPKSKLQWYSLFGRPTSIEGLANITGNSGVYEIFYRYASGFVHGNKIMTKALDAEGISGIRMPFNAQFICSFSLSLSFILFKKYVEHYCKDKLSDYLNWRISMRNIYLSVSNEELIKFE